MRSAALTNTEEVAEVSSWGAAPPSNIEEEELDILAFELWRRGSSPETPADDICLDAEENVLMPR